MAACSECGACSHCRTFDSDDCECCSYHGEPLEACGCQFCEKCECTEASDNWCEHGCNHCADCCEWHEEDDDDGEYCCKTAAIASGQFEPGPTEDNDYLDEVLVTLTAEQMGEAWVEARDRDAGIMRQMKPIIACKFGYNVLHNGAQCDNSYRPDLAVVHHFHTAANGEQWMRDFVEYGTTSSRQSIAPKDISANIHAAHGHTHHIDAPASGSGIKQII